MGESVCLQSRATNLELGAWHCASSLPHKKHSPTLPPPPLSSPPPCPPPPHASEYEFCTLSLSFFSFTPSTNSKL